MRESAEKVLLTDGANDGLALADGATQSGSGNGRMPKHVAIIMDGNGRWATERGRSRTFGHKAGVDAVRRTVRAAGDQGIAYLTLFGFSSENWNRPALEIDELFTLLRLFIRRDLADLHKNGVKIVVIGSRERLPKDIVSIIHDAETLTRDNSALHLTVAFNYGSRQEMALAAQKIAQDVAAGKVCPSTIDEKLFAAYLETAAQPDPDLVIRTSGEQRISNFLLWQSAYAEFFFSPVYWPDFTVTIWLLH